MTHFCIVLWSGGDRPTDTICTFVLVKPDVIWINKKSKSTYCLFSHLAHLFLPDTVEDISIRINPQHDVLHSCIVDKRALRVDEEHVGNPDLLHKSCVEGPTLIVAGGESQAIVLPVVPQVQGHGEVLENRTKPWHHRPRSELFYIQDNRYDVPCLLQICCQCSPPGRRCRPE